MFLALETDKPTLDKSASKHRSKKSENELLNSTHISFGKEIE